MNKIFLIGLILLFSLNAFAVCTPIATEDVAGTPEDRHCKVMCETPDEMQAYYNTAVYTPEFSFNAGWNEWIAVQTILDKLQNKIRLYPIGSFMFETEQGTTGRFPLIVLTGIEGIEIPTRIAGRPITRPQADLIFNQWISRVQIALTQPKYRFLPEEICSRGFFSTGGTPTG